MGTTPLDEAFTAFVEDSSASLGRTAWLLTGDHDRARELVQAALVKTLQAWDRIGEGAALAYTRRALLNENIDRWRRRHGEVAVGLTFERASSESVEDAVATRDRVARMLAELPLAQRRVVVLRYYEDLSEAQVADLLGMTVGAVKASAHRALTTLRAHYPTADDREGAWR